MNHHLCTDQLLKKIGSSRIYSDEHLLAIDVIISLGQEVLRGKLHLSRRCFALAGWNDYHLHRRQPCCKAISPIPTDANMHRCRGVLTGQSKSFLCYPSKLRKSHTMHLGILGEIHLTRMLRMYHGTIPPLPFTSFSAQWLMLGWAKHRS